MLDLAYSLADQNAATGKSIGIYNFAIHCARHLAAAPEVERMTVFSNPTVTPALNCSQRAKVFDYPNAIAGKLGRMVWDQWGLYRATRRAGHNWLFLPKGFSSFMVRPTFNVAAYVHDTMGEYYHRHYRGYEPRLEYEYFARCMAATLRRSRVVFTNSEFSRGEILKLSREWNLPQPNVIVAGYGFDVSRLGEAPAEPKSFENKAQRELRPTMGAAPKQNRVLLFASKVPHKRTDIAMRFLDHWLRQTRFEGQIDCIGILSSDMARPSGPAWNWVGRVPPERGREFMRQARAVVYVSEYEGFGMPPVEAVMEGTCPVYSDIPPIRETMGGAGFPFRNEAPEEFVAAMQRALETPAEAIAGWADQLLRRHNWQSVTRRIIDGMVGAG